MVEQMNDNNVALYLDFENLAISADETYPSKDKPLSIEPIVDFAASKGNICVKKSYADWSRNIFKQYQKHLLDYGFEMIYLPATSSQGKNGSDVRMAIDIMENMELFKTIDTFIIGSGDTDFISLTQRMLARGKKVIIVGFDNSVGRLVKNNCTEFRSLDELLAYPDTENELEACSESGNQLFKVNLSNQPNCGTETSFQLGNVSSTNLEESSARDLLIRYIKAKSNEDPVSLSQLKMDLLRLQPSFSEKKLGYSSFKKYILSMEGDLIKKVSTKKTHPIVFFKDYQDIDVKQINQEEEIVKYLHSAARFIKSPSRRSNLCSALFNLFKDKEIISLSEAIEYLSSKSEGLSKISIRKFIHTLASANVFIFAEKEQHGPLLSRPQKLNNFVNSPNDIESAYIDYIKERIVDLFPNVEDDILSPYLNEYKV
ncbi:NYN domain-containing protein [Methanococcoides sp. SA1]|nr:NYN domain-containing protein [Methanococcoides sp. SA1]